MIASAEAMPASVAKRLLIPILPLLVVGLLAWAAVSRETRIAVGKTTPTFLLPRFDGGSFDLSAQRGRPVFINFWASWCLPCRDEAPHLARAEKEFAATDLVMVGVNSDDLESDAREYVSTYALGFLMVRDTSGDVGSDYGVAKFPESFLLDRNGLLVERVYGPMTYPEMRAKIRSGLSPSDAPR